jgi:protein SCO1/2
VPAEPAASQPPGLEPSDALHTSQAVVGKAIGDHTLLDRVGRPVRLSSYRGKPLLVSFIYTGCFQVCPTSTRSLYEAVRALQKVVGADQFNVISIGFNQPADSPQALRAFALQNGIDAPNWEFLSPHASIVKALTRDFGFSYVATPAGFDHLLAVTVVDAQGRIYAQVYGERLAADELGEPLRELLRGTPMPQSLRLIDIIDRVRILCTVYDPVTGQYRYAYGLIIEIAGGVTFALAMLWFFLAEWRARRLSRLTRITEQAATASPR